MPDILEIPREADRHGEHPLAYDFFLDNFVRVLHRTSTSKVDSIGIQHSKAISL